ncbi:MAG: hypothetical protein QW478_04130 [Candidatus Micrarchaeaceae archaeon]
MRKYDMVVGYLSFYLLDSHKDHDNKAFIPISTCFKDMRYQSFKKEVDYRVGRDFLLFVLNKIEKIEDVGQTEVIVSEGDKFLNIKLNQPEDKIQIDLLNNKKRALITTKTDNWLEARYSLKKEMGKIIDVKLL